MWVFASPGRTSPSALALRTDTTGVAAEGAQWLMTRYSAKAAEEVVTRSCSICLPKPACSSRTACARDPKTADRRSQRHLDRRSRNEPCLVPNYSCFDPISVFPKVCLVLDNLVLVEPHIGPSSAPQQRSNSKPKDFEPEAGIEHWVLSALS